MRRTFLALAALMLSAPAAAPAAEVWIGGSRAWGDFTTPGNEKQWAFLAANADGLYINNFAMRPEEAKRPTHAERIAGMYRLLKSKKLFYETDLVHSSDPFDAEAIVRLKKPGFEYVGVTCNRDTNATRDAILTDGGKVPLYYMVGPWNQGGSIDSDKSAKLREEAVRYAGAAVDAPVTVWSGNKGRMKEFIYSAVKWMHERDRKFLYLLAPNESGPKFLEESQKLVREMEDHDTYPDVWAVAFYGPQSFRDKLETLPEADDAGKPAKTFSGVPYWLMHHLKDPKGWAKLSVPPQLGVEVKGEVVSFSIRDLRARELTFELKNASDWCDFAPVVRLKSPGGMSNAWNIKAALDGEDVSAAFNGEGFICNQSRRLNSGDRRQLKLTISQVTKDASPQAEWTIELRPNASEAAATQALTLRLR